MLDKIAIGTILGICSAAALAQPSDIQAPAPASAYLQDSRGMVVRSGSALCWRTGYWTPADAVAGCDGELLPPVAKPTAPAVVAPPLAQAAVSEPVAPPPPPRCDFALTLQNDATFAFDRAALSAAAQARLRQEVVSRLGTCSKVESVVITGHADRIGSASYNLKLSQRRAEAVAAFLRAAGVDAPLQVSGVGETQPVQDCDQKLSRAQLVRCLAPNRRVVVEVSGQGR